jgi:hypothetical protein
MGYRWMRLDGVLQYIEVTDFGWEPCPKCGVWRWKWETIEQITQGFAVCGECNYHAPLVSISERREVLA